MAANIDTSKGFNAFASLTGRAWWGEGQQVAKYATPEEICRAAGIDFHVMAAPVEYTIETGSRLHATGRRVLYRSDTGAALGVVGDQYTVHQPLEVVASLRDMIRPGGWHIRTAGALDGGARVWAMAFRDERETVTPDNPDDGWVENGLLLCTSFNGTTRTAALQTNVEVVCANTWRAAFDENKQGKKKRAGISHRSDMSASELLEGVGLTLQGDDIGQSFAASIAQARMMATIGVSEAEARDMLDGLLRGKARPLSDVRASISREPVAALQSGALDFAALLAGPSRAGSVAMASGDDVAKEHRNVQKIISLWQGDGIAADAHKGSAFGLFRALTEWKDHHAARTEDARVKAGQWGVNAEMAQDFARLLTA